MLYKISISMGKMLKLKAPGQKAIGPFLRPICERGCASCATAVGESLDIRTYNDIEEALHAAVDKSTLLQVGDEFEWGGRTWRHAGIHVWPVQELAVTA